MDRDLIAKYLSLFSALVALLVIIGWFFNIPLLTSILPHWVTMKFTTAISFLFSAGIVASIAIQIRKEKGITSLSIPIYSVMLLFLMGLLLLSVIIGVRTGIEDLFVEESEKAILSTSPGTPSIGTMVSFVLIGLNGLLFSFLRGIRRKQYLFFGWGILLLGLAAATGYLLNMPQLYYAIEGISTAMALHTAILFILLGLALVLLGFEKKNEIKETTIVTNEN